MLCNFNSFSRSDDKQFQALGFGAKVPPDGRLSHEFFMVSSSVKDIILA